MTSQLTPVPVLVVLGGLPATGKSTVAAALVRQTGFAFVRVDRIEQAIVASSELEQPLGPVGYVVTYEVAGEQLAHGVGVVTESVNPLAVTRNAWRDVAARHGAGLVEVELICSDPAAHQYRAQSRQVGVAGLRPPDWAQITSREYEPWDRDHLVIDTASQKPAEAASVIVRAVEQAGGHVPAGGGEPAAGQIRRITFVPFTADGRCVLIETPSGPALPAGDVHDGEDYRDAVLRIPMATAGFRYQRFGTFGRDGGHLYAWIEGGPYTGHRPHTHAELSYGPAEHAAGRLAEHGDPDLAGVVLAAARSYRAQDEQAFYAENARNLERSYLAASTPELGSGFGGDSLAWRQARWHLTGGIESDGSFLDVGCANGLLMESVAAWCAGRGLSIEPYGVDISPALAALARRRLPHWADRIWTGNAIDWLPPGGQRFDYVHILLDSVPWARRADLIRHHLGQTVRPGSGLLLVSDYAANPAAGHPFAAAAVAALGFRCAGQSSGGDRPGRLATPTAWISAGSPRLLAPPVGGAGHVGDDRRERRDDQCHHRDGHCCDG